MKGFFSLYCGVTRQVHVLGITPRCLSEIEDLEDHLEKLHSDIDFFFFFLTDIRYSSIVQLLISDVNINRYQLILICRVMELTHYG